MDRPGQTRAPRPGTPLSSSRRGETSLSSPLGVKGSPRFRHACRHVIINNDGGGGGGGVESLSFDLFVFYRDPPILEDLFPRTSSLHPSTNPLHHPMDLGASPLGSCRMTFPPDTILRGRTPPTASTTLRATILEVSPHPLQNPLMCARTLNSQFCLTEMPGPPPPPHHPSPRLPPPGMAAEHPPWAGGQHPEFGPTQHGFNGHSPHVRQRQPPVQDDPSLVPNVPYFDLPAGLMAPLVKVSLNSTGRRPFPVMQNTDMKSV